MKDRVCHGALGLFRKNQSGSVTVTQRGGALHFLTNEASFRGARESMHNPAWFAVQTRSKHERIASHHLARLGVSHYLPIVSEIHRWSDRRKKVELPLFPGYLFVQIIAHVERRVEVLRTPGIVRFVGSSPEGAPIPDVQIEFVRKLISEKVPWESHPFLKAGQRIRIRGGALDQVEGVFVR